ncbi:MAG: polyribonucleotide nucleotidyltransferase [Patescibacteria group bacterium]
MQTKTYEMEYCGKKLKVEISDLADQANGSVLVRYGETAVFATAVMAKNKKEGMSFFPLTVDYEEKFYAAGRIMGGRFMKREGRPSEEAILTARIIDRTIRPMFDKRLRNELQVIVMALSIDGKNDPDVPAIIAASLALGISDIPWGGPVGAVRVGQIDGKFVFNPTYEEREKTNMDMVVCGKDGKVNMIEAGAKEVSEEIATKGVEEALKEVAKVEDFQKNVIKEIGKEKIKIEMKDKPKELVELFNKNILPKLEAVLYTSAQGGQDRKKPDVEPIEKEWADLIKESGKEELLSFANEIFEDSVDELVHSKVIDTPKGQEKRQDGRRTDEIRSLHASVGLLPVLHGSAVFYRGNTHILSTVTLGGPQDAQLIEGMEIQTTKHFMHHYNFPPFSVGETGRMGSPGRREIGHGALVERALLPVVPPKSEFPYTIRIVSESMASNGSTSQGSICASTMALMDAGVPIKNPVAGISMGLMMRSDKEYRVLTDIQGFEDHFGDMDFKCAGTKDGITAIQLDIKVGGIPLEAVRESFEQARKARMEILGVMSGAIAEPRKELSPTAPRIIKMMINPEKIREVIGPGGKMINSIIDKTGAEIDIEQDGSVYITGKNLKEADEAKKIIEGITHEYLVGELVSGPVSRLFDFGAMVEIGPMQEGLVHISELAPFRVNKVTDVVNMGDIVKAKIINIDEKGRVNLSIKQLDPNYKGGNNNHGGGKFNDK